MRKWILAAAVALVFAGTACTQQTSATYSNASGSVALSRDDSLVYAVDTDNEIVAVIDAATQKKIAEVKVGAAPEQIVVAPDDTLYVSNRGSRSVSVIEKGQWSEAARIAVGVEPTGLAVSPDSNVNMATDAREAMIFGLPFELSDEARRVSGTTATATLHADRTVPIAGRWRLAVGGAARFADPEGPGLLHVEPDAIRAAYREELQAHLDALREGAKARRIRYDLMTTSTPYHQALSTYLTSRGRL